MVEEGAPRPSRNQLAAIHPNADLAEAEWWETDRGSGTPPAVGFLIPRGFEAYARVLHPAQLHDENATEVSWATVADECGTTLHPEAQWWRLAGRSDFYSHDGEWVGENPAQGELEATRFTVLAGVLGRHTTTPERTIVAFWVGYGVWPADWSSLPTTRRPVRESHLFERPLGDVPALCAEAPERGFWQSPSAWWPADRAWATSNDTDLDSTLVGGSRALVDELIADDRLEALSFPEDGSLWSDADTINQRAR